MPVATSIQRAFAESWDDGPPSIDEIWRGFLEEYIEGATAVFGNDAPGKTLFEAHFFNFYRTRPTVC